MSTFDGTLLKTLLILAPSYATDDNIRRVRDHLTTNGFIIVREEHRELSTELLFKIGVSSEQSPTLLGNCYVLVLCRSNVFSIVDLPVITNGGIHVFVPKPNCSTRAVLALFPRMLCDPIPSNAEANDYIQSELKSTLIAALTAVAKEKPENPIEWVARYLLDNNPQSPAVSLKSS